MRLCAPRKLNLAPERVRSVGQAEYQVVERF
jgi:hypothetical protein